jgi:hypothetical protein
MSDVKKLPKWVACCEITIRGTDRVCGNAAAYEWKGRKLCGMHVPRRHCSVCNRPLPLWDILEVPFGGDGTTVPMCPSCAQQHEKAPFSIETIEERAPRRPAKRGKLCPVCYSLPHRRATPKCKGCGQPPGPAT